MIGIAVLSCVVCVLTFYYVFVLSKKNRQAFSELSDKIDEMIERERYKRDIMALYEIIYNSKEMPFDFMEAYERLTAFELQQLRDCFMHSDCDRDKLISEVISGKFKKVVDKYYTDSYTFKQYYTKSEN